jgi:Single-strand binding protein family
MNINDVKIVGNLVKEPEVRYTPKGTPVANISLGVNESYTIDDEKRKVTTFVDVQVWGPAPKTLLSWFERVRRSLSKALFGRRYGMIRRQEKIGPSCFLRLILGNSRSTKLSRNGGKRLKPRRRGWNDEIRLSS